MLQALFQGARELFFPDNCLLCRQFLDSGHTRQLCPECLKSMAANPFPFRHSGAGPFAFDQAWSACLYNETAQKLIHAFKYSSKTALGRTFVPLMVDFIDRHHLPLSSFDLMTPIPLHPARLRERGYNQSALLSAGLSRHYGICHREDVLLRWKMTGTQTELGAKQRWTNLEGAFTIKNPKDIQGRNIILVDDLYTTGATLHHAAEALKAAGAKQVAALTFCITP